MISILIAFRFPPRNVCLAQEIETVERVFSHWEQLAEKYPIELVFINDHSDNFWLNKPYIYPMHGTKVNWNQAASRNYAATLAKGDKFLFTDIDHILDGDLNALDKMSLHQKYFKFCRISLIDSSGKDIRPHTNTFLILAKDFVQYDEDFCGNYGYEDTEFFFRLRKTHEVAYAPKELAFTCVLKLPRPTLSRNKAINENILYLKTFNTKGTKDQ